MSSYTLSNLMPFAKSNHAGQPQGSEALLCLDFTDVIDPGIVQESVCDKGLAVMLQIAKKDNMLEQ